MKLLLIPSVLIAAVVLGTGCTSVRKLVTADVTIQYGTNLVRVSQPKDTTIKELTLSPAGGLTLKGYTSTANAGAIAAAEAQSQMVTAVFGQAVELGREAATVAMRAYGLPTPGATSAPAPAAAVVPKPKP